jgi:hypothetical protein
VRIELDEERITIAAAGHEVGAWSLDEIEIVNREHGFEILAEDEHLFVSTDDDSGFALEVGMRRISSALSARSDPVEPAQLMQSGIDISELTQRFRNRRRTRTPGPTSFTLKLFKGRHEQHGARRVPWIFRL